MEPETFIQLPDHLFARCIENINMSCYTSRIRDVLSEDILEPLLERLSTLGLTINKKHIRGYRKYYPKLFRRYKHLRVDTETRATVRYAQSKIRNIESYRRRFVAIERQRYNPSVYTKNNGDVIARIDIDYDIIVPKLLEKNPSGLHVLVHSKKDQDMLWLDKYLNMTVNGISVLAFLLVTGHWKIILKLPSAQHVRNLRRDLEVSFVSYYHDQPQESVVLHLYQVIQDLRSTLPDWFQ